MSTHIIRPTSSDDGTGCSQSVQCPDPPAYSHHCLGSDRLSEVRRVVTRTGRTSAKANIQADIERGAASPTPGSARGAPVSHPT